MGDTIENVNSVRSFTRLPRKPALLSLILSMDKHGCSDTVLHNCAHAGKFESYSYRYIGRFFFWKNFFNLMKVTSINFGKKGTIFTISYVSQFTLFLHGNFFARKKIFPQPTKALPIRLFLTSKA